jgi:hypothetical protein
MKNKVKKELKDEDLKILDVKKPNHNFIEVHPNLPPIPNITLFISPPASGKTLLLINFVYRFYNDIFDEIYWCSPTINLDNTLDSSVKKDETIIKISGADELMNIDAIIKYLIESQKEKLEKDEELEHILLVLDDCISFVNGKMLLELCTIYRHLKITVWISIQKMKLLNNTIRTCASNVISFAIPNKKQREQFLDEFDSFPDIEKYYEYCTKEKYNWMRLDMRNMKIYHGSPNGIVKIYEK